MKTLIVALYCCFIAQVKGFNLEDVINEEIVESSSSQPNIVLFYVDDVSQRIYALSTQYDSVLVGVWRPSILWESNNVYTKH